MTAWIRRFLHNCQTPRSERRSEESLSAEEARHTRILLLRISQQECYQEILLLIKANKNIPKSHGFHKYDMSIDRDHLLRLSGHVRQRENEKLPLSLIPLSLNSSLTKLFNSSLHYNMLHPSVSSLLCVLAEQYHVPGLKRYLKSLYRKCVVCQKAHAKPTTPPMGMLPAERTTPSLPFSHTGLDFAGPFQIKQGHTRRLVILKSYACVFICMATKAVHLELCADLTTKEFLSALRRFCARRGLPSHIYSDNGTNFIGARNETIEIQKLLKSKSTKEAISHFSTSLEVEWHFIPPRAPHFGGLWEAAVKAMKILLRKIVKSHILAFQELATVLTEAEAMLNSRPITPNYSTDADAPLTLTPGHFLIGRPLISPPVQEADDLNQHNMFKCWNNVQRLQ